MPLILSEQEVYFHGIVTKSLELFITAASVDHPDYYKQSMKASLRRRRLNRDLTGVRKYHSIQRTGHVQRPGGPEVSVTRGG